MHTQYYQEGLERLGGTAADYGETLQRLNNLSVMQPYNQKIGACAKIISFGTLQTFAKSSSSASQSSQKIGPTADKEHSRTAFYRIRWALPTRKEVGKLCNKSSMI